VEGSDEETVLSQGFERTVVEMCGLRTMGLAWSCWQAYRTKCSYSGMNLTSHFDQADLLFPKIIVWSMPCSQNAHAEAGRGVLSSN